MARDGAEQEAGVEFEEIKRWWFCRETVFCTDCRLEYHADSRALMDCDRGPDLVRTVRLGRRSNLQTRGVQGLMSECSECSECSGCSEMLLCEAQIRGRPGPIVEAGRAAAGGALTPRKRMGAQPGSGQTNCVLERKDGVLWD